MAKFPTNDQSFFQKSLLEIKSKLEAIWKDRHKQIVLLNPAELLNQACQINIDLRTFSVDVNVKKVLLLWNTTFFNFIMIYLTEAQVDLMKNMPDFSRSKSKKDKDAEPEIENQFDEEMMKIQKIQMLDKELQLNDTNKMNLEAGVKRLNLNEPVSNAFFKASTGIQGQNIMANQLLSYTSNDNQKKNSDFRRLESTASINTPGNNIQSDRFLFKDSDSIDFRKNSDSKSSTTNKSAGSGVIKVNIGKLILFNFNKSAFQTEFLIQKIQVSISEANKEKTIEVCAGELHVNDLTSYPFTKKLYELYDLSQLKRSPIIKMKTKKPDVYKIKSLQNTQIAELFKKHALICNIKMKDMSICQPNEDDPRIMANVYIHNLSIVYYQQLIFRLIDFLTLNVIPFLSPDITPTDRDKLYEKMTEIYKTLYRVELYNCSIFLKPNFLFEKYFRITTSEVIVFNSINKDVSKMRDLAGKGREFFCESISININDIFMSGFFANKQTNIASNMNIIFERLLYLKEIKEYYGEGDFFMNVDFGTRIKISTNVLQLALFKNDYIFFMACLFNNIIFDDLKSREYQYVDVSDNFSMPMKLQVFIDHFYIYFRYEKEHEKPKVFAVFTIPDMKIEYIKQKTSEKKILLTASYIRSSGFEVFDAFKENIFTIPFISPTLDPSVIQEDDPVIKDFAHNLVQFGTGETKKTKEIDLEAFKNKNAQKDSYKVSKNIGDKKTDSRAKGPSLILDKNQTLLQNTSKLKTRQDARMAPNARSPPPVQSDILHSTQQQIFNTGHNKYFDLKLSQIRQKQKQKESGAEKRPLFWLTVDIDTTGNNNTDIILEDHEICLIQNLIYKFMDVTKSADEININALLQPLNVANISNLVITFDLLNSFIILPFDITKYSHGVYLFVEKLSAYFTKFNRNYSHAMLESIRFFKAMPHIVSHDADQELVIFENSYERDKFRIVENEVSAEMYGVHMFLFENTNKYELLQCFKAGAFSPKIAQQNCKVTLNVNNAAEIRFIFFDLEFKTKSTNYSSDTFKSLILTKGETSIKNLDLALTGYDLNFIVDMNESLKQFGYDDLTFDNAAQEEMKKILILQSRENAMAYQYNPNKAQPKQRKFARINPLQAQIIILDDVYGSMLPIINLVIKTTATVNYKSHEIEGYSNINLNIEGNYFNSRIRFWEPLIENFELQISKTLRLKINEDLVAVSTLNNGACINVSSELIDLAMAFQGNMSVSRLQTMQFCLFGQNNMFVLNKTGYNLEIEFIYAQGRKQSVIVLENASTQIKPLSQIGSSFDQQNPVKVSIYLLRLGKIDLAKKLKEKFSKGQLKSSQNNDSQFSQINSSKGPATDNWFFNNNAPQALNDPIHLSKLLSNNSQSSPIKPMENPLKSSFKNTQLSQTNINEDGNFANENKSNYALNAPSSENFFDFDVQKNPNSNLRSSQKTNQDGKERQEEAEAKEKSTHSEFKMVRGRRLVFERDLFVNNVLSEHPDYKLMSLTQFEKTKLLVTLHSAYEIRNNTDLFLKIKFCYKGCFLTKKSDPNTVLSVPLLFENGGFCVRGKRKLHEKRRRYSGIICFQDERVQGVEIEAENNDDSAKKSFSSKKNIFNEFWISFSSNFLSLKVKYNDLRKEILLNPSIIIENRTFRDLKISDAAGQGFDVELGKGDTNYLAYFEVKEELSLVLTFLSLTSEMVKLNKTEFLKRPFEKKIWLFDAKRHPRMKIYLHVPDSDSLRFIFYHKSILINETFMEWWYSQSFKLREIRSTSIMPAVETSAQILFLKHNRSVFFGEQGAPKNSRITIDISKTGNKFYTLVDKDNIRNEFSVTIEDKKVSPFAKIAQKVVHFAPKFIFINKTKHEVTLFELLHSRKEVVKSQNRSSISVVEDPSTDYLFKLRLYESNWSETLNIALPGFYSFSVIHKFERKAYFLNLEVNFKNNSFYIILFENEFGVFKIINDLPDVCILIYQKELDFGGTDYDFEVRPNEAYFYSWRYPLEPTNFLYILLIDSKTRKVLYKTNLDIQRSHIKKDLNFGEMRAYLEMIRQGWGTMIRVFSASNTLDKIEDANQTIKISQKLIKIQNLGLSLIIGKGVHRTELLYAHFKGLEYSEIAREQFAERKFTLDYFTIDFNAKNEAAYPVLFAPRFEEKVMIDKKSKFLALNFKVSNDKKGLTVFEKVNLDIYTSVLKIEEEFLINLLSFYTDFNRESAERAEFFTKKFKFSMVTKKPKEVQLQNWKTIEIEEMRPLYFQIINLPKIEILISFKKSLESRHSDRHFALYFDLINTLGVFLTNIEDMPLTLPEIRLSPETKSVPVLQERIISIYKTIIFKSVIKLVASANILGNPMNLYNEVAMGVQDMIDMPTERGGKGLVEGTGSLLKHVIAGTSGTVNKMTRNLGDGVSSLTTDREYLVQRERLFANPENRFIVGLKQLGFGIYDGLSGLLLKPIKGAQKKGFQGAMQGTYQGVSGLVFKPITGMLDLASATADGIKQLTMNKENQTPQLRRRPPRPFYSNERYYKIFDSKDANIGAFQKTVDGYHLVLVEKINCDMEQIVICLEGVLIIDEKDILWRKNVENLIGTVKTPGLLTIEFYDIKDSTISLETKLIDYIGEDVGLRITQSISYIIDQFNQKVVDFGG